MITDAILPNTQLGEFGVITGHGPTLRGWQRALLALPASRSTGLQSLRRHDRLASSACTRFKVALSMTAYSTGHSLVHDDDEICAYSMLSKVNKVPPLSGGPATAYTKAWFNIVRRAMR